MKIKYYPVFGGIRVLVLEGGHHLFCANDIASALAYKDPGRAVRRHCSDGYLFIIPTGGGRQATKFIDDADVLRLIVHAGNDQSEALRDWLIEAFPTFKQSVSPSDSCPGTFSDKEQGPVALPENEQLLKELQSVRQELNDLKMQLNSLTMDRQEPLKEKTITLEEFCMMFPQNQPKPDARECWLKSLFARKPATGFAVPSLKNVCMRIVILDK